MAQTAQALPAGCGSRWLRSQLLCSLNMARHSATVDWVRGDAPFSDRRYSRGHSWRFDGGLEVQASSSPQVVPVPMSVAAAVDPEEAFVASLSSCHMLWFLDLAARAGLVVDRYRDDAIGIMSQDPSGRLAMTLVELRPTVEFAGTPPSAAALSQLHERAHHECFLANSVKTEIRIAAQAQRSRHE